MPSDITGTDILQDDPESGRRKFAFVAGPVFAHIILADEINRTPPKTQAALLEAMQERHVTAGGRTYPLPDPFFVLATQNPIEQEGTYPLPEAQLDRFMLNIQVNYPSPAEELEILRRTTGDEAAEPTSTLTAERIASLQRLVRRMPVAEHVFVHARDLVRASRPGEPEAPPLIRKAVTWAQGRGPARPWCWRPRPAPRCTAGSTRASPTSTPWPGPSSATGSSRPSTPRLRGPRPIRWSRTC